MEINEIGTLIRKGMSTEDIQKQIRDFPSKITTEYFESLGYEHLDAIKYKCTLRHNDFKSKERKIKAERELLKEDGSFIMSDNADPNNIIIDTCAFQFKKSINVIDKSEKVTVLNEVIKEMDKVSQRETCKINEFLLYNIRHYVVEMLLNKTKYHIIEYKNDDKSYVDDILIEYLESLKEKQRPTLLTADKILALRAQTAGLEFILVIETQNKKENKDESNKACVSSKEKYLNRFGVEVTYCNESGTIRKSNQDAKVLLIKEDRCEEIKEAKKINRTDFDYITIMKKDKKHKKVRLANIKIVKNKMNISHDEFQFINEIYKLDLHPEVLETIKNLLINK